MTWSRRTLKVGLAWIERVRLFKESIEKRRELLYGHSLYGSLSIDSPPISDDRRYLFKASDSVVWIRAFKVEAELKDALFKEGTHDEQVF